VHEKLRFVDDRPYKGQTMSNFLKRIGGRMVTFARGISTVIPGRGPIFPPQTLTGSVKKGKTSCLGVVGQ